MKYLLVGLVLIFVLCLISFSKAYNEVDATSETNQSLHGTVASKQGSISKIKKKFERKLSRTMKNNNEHIPFQQTVDDTINNNISRSDGFYEDDYNDVSAMVDLDDNSISSYETYEEENNDYYPEEGDEESYNQPLTGGQKISKPNSYNKKVSTALVSPLNKQIRSSYKRKSRKTNSNKKSRSTKKVPWEPWSNWSPCSVSCGSGIQTRWRNSMHDTNSNSDTPDREMEEKKCQMPACSPLDLLSILIA